MNTDISDGLIEIQGQIERVTYTNEENGYTVARVKVYGRSELVTVTGSIMDPTPGEIIRMRGRWTNHPQYGEQFRIESYQCTVPATIYGIKKYLGSGLIKGIGPVMADRIVKVFEEDTLDVIEKEIEKLAEVDGIGKKRIDMIRKAWDEQKEIRSVMLFLQSHGVSSAYATKIYREYGNESINIVQENPYKLAMDIFGIGFITADKIAEKLGYSRASELRAEAGIIYVLNQLSDDGHVYYPYDMLIEKCQEILEVDRGLIVKAMDNIAADRRIIVEDIDNIEGDVSSVKAVYLAKYYLCENSIASRIRVLMDSQSLLREFDTEKAISWVQGQLSMELAERQIEAVRCAAENKVMVITGGPGTGKTTIIRAIIRIFSALKAEIMLAAPTGRAAKRMSEATGYEAKTIHRLLEYGIQQGGFQRDDDNPLDCDMLIVDEASMIDTILMHHLLKAVPKDAKLILVGDVNQLPSVGAGNVLGDIIDSDVIPVVELNEIFRQAKESSIIVNGHRINSGQMPDIENSDRLSDFYFIPQEDPETVLESIVSLVHERIPKRFGFDSVDDIQVITPMKRGVVGTDSLNTQLQNALNPGGSEITRGGRSFRMGDKVMQIRNNYDKEVFNGDIGRILRIDDEEQEMTVLMDDREISYEYSELDEIVLAYAVSVHKSQGSEYPVVVMPVLTQHYVLLQRNLIYTGVTRGKKLVVLIGTRKALAIAVKNNRTEKRYTHLRERLRSGTNSAIDLFDGDNI